MKKPVTQLEPLTTLVPRGAAPEHRVRISWQAPGSPPWPSSTPKHLFLGDAIIALGKAMFGDQWEGNEPSIDKIVRPWDALTNPSSKRWLSVQQRLLEGLRRELLKSSVRDLAGKHRDSALSWYAVKAEEWYLDDPWPRFAFCQMKFTPPWAYGPAYRWIFVDTQDLATFVKSAAKTVPDPVLAATSDRIAAFRDDIIARIQASPLEKKLTWAQADELGRDKYGLHPEGRKTGWKEAVRSPKVAGHVWSNRGRPKSAAY